MWLFRKPKDSKEPKYTTFYAVNDLYFESMYDAVIEASRLELIAPAGGSTHFVRELQILKLSKATGVTTVPDAGIRLGIVDLPPVVRASVLAHIAAKEKLGRERDAVISHIASELGPKWNRMVSEHRSKVDKCVKAKDVAIKSYVYDRGVTSAKVRELCDSYESASKLSLNTLLERGQAMLDEKLLASGYIMKIEDMIEQGLFDSIK